MKVPLIIRFKISPFFSMHKGPYLEHRMKGPSWFYPWPLQHKHYQAIMTSPPPVLCTRPSSQLVFFRFFRLLFFSNEFFFFPVQNAFLPFATQYTYYTYTSSPSLFAIISLETFQSFQRKHAFFCVPIRRLILISMFITFL